jgi:stress-induced morphogen
VVVRVAGQVMRETEDKLDVIGCLGRRGYCRIERVCVLRGVLYDALQAFLAVLDGYTLADLIKPQRALSSLFLLEPQRFYSGRVEHLDEARRGHGCKRYRATDPRAHPGRRGRDPGSCRRRDHYKATVIAESFRGKSRVLQHQIV